MSILYLAINLIHIMKFSPDSPEQVSLCSAALLHYIKAFYYLCRQVKNADGSAGQLLILYIELQTTMISIMSTVKYLCNDSYNIVPCRFSDESNHVFQERMAGEDITHITDSISGRSRDFGQHLSKAQPHCTKV